MQLAAYRVSPMRESKARALFEAGAIYLRKHHRHLHPLANGMSNAVMIELAHHLLTKASTDKLTFSGYRYTGIDDSEVSKPFRCWVNQNLNAGYPVICCLYDPAHFTVISRFSPNGIILFDSQKRSRFKVSRRDQLSDHVDPNADIAISACRPTAGVKPGMVNVS